MISQLEQRLRELKSEFEAGQKMLADLEAQQNNLRETLLRIDGAIQVLEEVLNAESPVVENGQSLANVEAEAVETGDLSHSDHAKNHL